VWYNSMMGTIEEFGDGSYMLRGKVREDLVAYMLDHPVGEVAVDTVFKHWNSGIQTTVYFRMFMRDVKGVTQFRKEGVSKCFSRRELCTDEEDECFGRFIPDYLSLTTISRPNAKGEPKITYLTNYEKLVLRMQKTFQKKQLKQAFASLKSFVGRNATLACTYKVRILLSRRESKRMLLLRWKDISFSMKAERAARLLLREEATGPKKKKKNRSGTKRRAKPSLPTLAEENGKDGATAVPTPPQSPTLLLSELKLEAPERRGDDGSTSIATALSCVVCFEQESEFAVVPCGHRSLCEWCAKKVKHCPICRTEAQLVIRIFG
jgi:hypothetical protein